MLCKLYSAVPKSPRNSIPGRLKIGELGTPPGLTALAKGARFKIVGSSVRRGAVQYFVVHPRFGDWQDLLGANLGALSRGSCSDWYMREVLASSRD